MEGHRILVEKMESIVKNPPLTSYYWGIISGCPEGADIQVLHNDSYGRFNLDASEAVLVVSQFLEQNPDLQLIPEKAIMEGHSDPQPIPMSLRHPNSRYILCEVGEQQIWIFIAWLSGFKILIMLPQNRQLEPVRTDDSSKIPSFKFYQPGYQR